MADQLLIELSLILGVAALAAIIAKIVRQPQIIAYLVAGIAVGPIFLGLLGTGRQAGEMIDLFAHLGISLLLFIIGLSLDFRVLKEFGKVSALTGVGSMLATGIIGFGVALSLGFTLTHATYLALALCFSSTVVVVKILSDKKELDTLHGRIALGILIVESFIAAIVLMLIPIVQSGNMSAIFLGVGKLLLLCTLALLFYQLVIKRCIDYLARNQEVLFLSGLAYALVLSSLFSYLGLSMEIGALIAGISLASSKYALDISGKVRPLRDFFVIILFVYFGSQLVLPITLVALTQALALSATLFIVKPLVIMAFMKGLGYKKRTNFFTGASLAQMSEFSLIVILMGYGLGALDADVMNLAVLIALLTIAVSSYSIYYSAHIFNKISSFLGLFDGKSSEIGLADSKNGSYDIILFGYHRMGSKILESLKKVGGRILVVDYNPKSIISLTKQGINCVYGDADDNEFLSDLKLGQAKLVISTIPDEESSLAILKILDETSSKAAFIATAEHAHVAADLYKMGVDYVIMPHRLGGEFMAGLISSHGLEPGKYKALGKQHLKSLFSERHP